MTTQKTLNIRAWCEEIAMKATQETLPELLMEIKNNSPIKSGTYMSQSRIKGIRKIGNTIVGTIINSGEYPENVEFGWRKKAVNWHLYNGTIFRSKGARVFERSLAKIQPHFLSRLGAK